MNLFHKYFFTGELGIQNIQILIICKIIFMKKHNLLYHFLLFSSWIWLNVVKVSSVESNNSSNNNLASESDSKSSKTPGSKSNSSNNRLLLFDALPSGSCKKCLLAESTVQMIRWIECWFVWLLCHCIVLWSHLGWPWTSLFWLRAHGDCLLFCQATRLLFAWVKSPGLRMRRMWKKFVDFWPKSTILYPKRPKITCFSPKRLKITFFD